MRFLIEKCQPLIFKYSNNRLLKLIACLKNRLIPSLKIFQFLPKSVSEAKFWNNRKMTGLKYQLDSIFDGEKN